MLTKLWILCFAWPSFYPLEPGDKKDAKLLIYAAWIYKETDAARGVVLILYNHIPYFKQMKILHAALERQFHCILNWKQSLIQAQLKHLPGKHQSIFHTVLHFKIANFIVSEKIGTEWIHTCLILLELAPLITECGLNHYKAKYISNQRWLFSSHLPTSAIHFTNTCH